MRVISLLFAFTAGCDALSTPPPQRAAVSTRRAAIGTGLSLAAVLTPAAAFAEKARTGLSSPFTGEYDDPQHPGCLRSVKVIGGKIGPDGRKSRKPQAYVKGTDGPNGKSSCPPGSPALKDVWSLNGEVAESGETITIDFSSKFADDPTLRERSDAARKALEAAKNGPAAERSNAARKALVAAKQGDDDAAVSAATKEMAAATAAEEAAVAAATKDLAAAKAVEEAAAAKRQAMKRVVGKWDTFDRPGIVFPDGNKWVKVEGGTPERRPELVQLNSD